VIKPVSGPTRGSPGIVIRLVSGHKQAYEARPSIQARLGTLVKGDAETLLLDADNKVTDVAFVPHGQR